MLQNNADEKRFTRDHESSLSITEKQVLHFLFKWKRPIRVSDLMRELEEEFQVKIKRTTLNSLLGRLEAKDFVIRQKRSSHPYRSISLTLKGNKIAGKYFRHLHILETFLYRTLNITQNEAYREAIELSPQLRSCFLIQKIASKYGNISECVCGEKIPSESICVCGDQLPVKNEVSTDLDSTGV